MLTKRFSNCTETHAQHKHDNSGATKIFGFWIYLMSDCILFGTLFATYAVLSNRVAGGPAGKDIFNLPLVLLETFFLLFSSITYGMAILAMYRAEKTRVNIWLGLTFFLGLNFICMELYEFHHLINAGYSPDRSAFLSSFFTLVGMHGMHVTAGLLWILVMMLQVSCCGLTSINQTRLHCLSLFWHFLDLVWICVFTVVYLIGTVS
ncbi:cytochrome o ubiquinol oxidase subunit III [Candidatus Steffania adelgidicola]|uniref:cytochrome o ubiquinol oxidase subunit III n=1 Tax=Candidatus Steffania adelgidicola TaxID=1076626 RepID=UPI001D018428|nr:cytochrome o ubiquinol oxidase subunit III [Candidatus Steffania adelgidicola]UDG79755.1 Cytochrome bo(3) ubiquinol oxidase subunit 3 [Candidatus Steffania adelgidicola]